MIRIAAVGDIHVGLDLEQHLVHEFDRLPELADVLLLAGDLTQHGDPAESAVLAQVLAHVPVPIIAVLGNHDYHQTRHGVIRGQLEAARVHVLEGESICLRLGGGRLGVAGVKGFGNGFIGACASEFGEQEMKMFVRHARVQAEALRQQLAMLVCDFKIALTHYSPVAETLAGERPEIFPFLGSYFLGEAIDSTRTHLAVHGHAHGGTERGKTPGGVPVRNVARPVIRRAYKVYCLGTAECEFDLASAAW